MFYNICVCKNFYWLISLSILFRHFVYMFWLDVLIINVVITVCLKSRCTFCIIHKMNNYVYVHAKPVHAVRLKQLLGNALKNAFKNCKRNVILKRNANNDCFNNLVAHNIYMITTMHAIARWCTLYNAAFSISVSVKNVCHSIATLGSACASTQPSVHCLLHWLSHCWGCCTQSSAKF